MGTVASIEVPGASVGAGDVAAVRGAFDRLEETFSLYRDDSELSRIARGEQLLTQSSPAVRSVYDRALEWRSATGGAFTPHRPDGVIDLDGIVKAIAIRDAGVELIDRGFDRWCLNVGGDVQVAGTPDSGAWQIGIVDPVDRTSILCVVALSEPRRAIATSGVMERGEHVWRTQADSDRDFVQVSVAADDIITADVLATAILSGGEAFRDIATANWDIDVLTVTRSGELSMTPGMRNALAART
ncbi:FAD:protein FMN transferase [Lacisediminihabitans sp. G11-30]|uniref:FAD:protein FMN transferase n=2 Tax=Lacisediminihabitans changchengi TaxID=2787634 RepID=A0A934SJL5_9MICO|nr:FAD:protein FMN transferase [Lacisediminihabitans changchengi]MBK4347887.1 FAD:protein FMN transferase [Lacisediminihabitans changchengi]